MLYYGRGLERDPALAYFWANIAVGNGAVEATDIRDLASLLRKPKQLNAIHEGVTQMATDTAMTKPLRKSF